MSFTDYLEKEVLNAVFRGVAFTSPSDVYVALFSTASSDDKAGTEVTGGGYNRQKITFGTPTDGTGDFSVIANTAELKFPIASAKWGTITHAGIYDAATGGNYLDHSKFLKPKAIDVDDQFTVGVGNLKVKLD